MAKKQTFADKARGKEAKKMVNVAKESGADAIKFQTFKTENMTIQNAQKDALARGMNNPLFRAGDIIYDGVICREVPEKR